MTITSLDNANIQLVKKLADKKYRKQTGLFVIEGERLVADAVKHGAKLTKVLVRESSAQKFNYDGALVVSDRIFDKISETVNSQGIVAVVNVPESDLSEPTGNALILDGLQDPGNVGTLIRTAASCGVTDVYFCNNCVDAYSPKVLRSAMSAHFCVKIHVMTAEEIKQVLGTATILVADLDGKNIFESKHGGKFALVLGNEANGVSDSWQGEKVVSLPMKNNFESLNVAVAGSVLMYQLTFGN